MHSCLFNMSSCSHSVTLALATVSGTTASADASPSLHSLPFCPKFLLVLLVPLPYARSPQMYKKNHVFFSCVFFHSSRSLSTGCFLLLHAILHSAEQHASVAFFSDLYLSRKYCLFTPPLRSLPIINLCISFLHHLHSRYSCSFLITNVHLCFCLTVSRGRTPLLTFLCGVYHAQAWSTVMRLLLYKYSSLMLKFQPYFACVLSCLFY